MVSFEIRSLLSLKELDALLATQTYASFHQSWAWGEYEQAIGREVARFGVYEDGTLVAGASFFKLALPLLGHYWYCPRGPVIASASREKILALIVAEAKKLGRQSGAVFVRFSPAWTSGSDFFNEVGCVSPHILLRRTEPDVTWITDVSPATDELLAAMHEKTRYNIRLAERKGVRVVEIAKLDEHFQSFWNLMSSTGRRQNFGIYPRFYYERLFDLNTYNLEPITYNLRLFIASLAHEALATALVVGFGDTVTYLYGGSTSAHREVMAPHLLHWEIMRWAKANGYRYYDWWGIAPRGGISNFQFPISKPSGIKYFVNMPWYGVRSIAPVQAQGEHPWEKLSRFKRGFGGEEYHTIGTWDLIVRPKWYRLLELVKRLRS